MPQALVQKFSKILDNFERILASIETIFGGVIMGSAKVVGESTTVRGILLVNFTRS